MSKKHMVWVDIIQNGATTTFMIDNLPSSIPPSQDQFLKLRLLEGRVVEIRASKIIAWMEVSEEEAQAAAGGASINIAVPGGEPH